MLAIKFIMAQENVAFHKFLLIVFFSGYRNGQRECYESIWSRSTMPSTSISSCTVRLSVLTCWQVGCRVILHHTHSLKGQPRRSRISCASRQGYYIVSMAAGIAITSSTSPLVERGMIPTIELQDDIRKGKEVQREFIKHSLSPNKPH